MQVGIGVGIECGIGVGIGSDLYTPTVEATLAARDLSRGVATTGGDWAAVLTWQQVGVVGNGKILSMRFDVGVANVEVRENEDPATGAWVATPGTVGVMVHANLGDPVTIAALEAAINAGSSLIQVSSPDPAPANEIDIATLDTENITGVFSGGI